MWIPRKKWSELEKRVADLEKKNQSQPDSVVATPLQEIKAALRESLCQVPQCSLEIERKEFVTGEVKERAIPMGACAIRDSLGLHIIDTSVEGGNV